MKRNITLLIMGLVASCSLVLAQPTDNPYKTKYGKSDHWTEDLPWSTVTDVTTTSAVTSGTTADLRFPDATGTVYLVDSALLQTVIKSISTSGGGVLYFPSGTYVMDFSLFIPGNVILRGDNPPSDKRDATQNNFSPPTKLIFPKYLYNGATNVPNSTAFKRIWSDTAAKHFGLVYLTINRAFVVFMPNFANPIHDGHEAPYKGTYVKKQASSLITNMIVFGLRITNAAQPDKSIPKLSGIPTQPNYHRWPNRRIGMISAFCWHNGVVANNRLGDTEGCANFGDGNPNNGEESTVYTNTTYPIPSDNFLMANYVVKNSNANWTCPDSQWFFYTHEYGIVYNRPKLFWDGLMYNWEGTEWAHTPDNEPASFGTNGEVIDNWVFKTNRPGFQVGGSGFQVKRNFIRDWAEKESYEQHISPAGLDKSVGQNTFENRGIDISGFNVYVDSNWMEAFRTLVSGGSYLSTDGEGILHQESSGSKINGMYITNHY